MGPPNESGRPGHHPEPPATTAETPALTRPQDHPKGNPTAAPVVAAETYTDNAELAAEVAQAIERDVAALREQWTAAKTRRQRTKLAEDGTLLSAVAADLRSGKWDMPPDLLHKQLHLTLHQLAEWVQPAILSGRKRICADGADENGCCVDPSCTPARHYPDVNDLLWLADRRPGQSHYLPDADLAEVIRARSEELREFADELETLADWTGPHIRRPGESEPAGGAS